MAMQVGSSLLALAGVFAMVVASQAVSAQGHRRDQCRFGDELHVLRAARRPAKRGDDLNVPVTR